MIIEELFARTRALTSFLMRPSGAQMVANLWKVLESARAYEAAAPATLRAFVRFLQDEEASSRAEGDSPVGESIGASVEESQASESRADFIHKLGVAQKEARESLYWLRLLSQGGIVAKKRIESLMQETNELVAIITAIIVNCKRKRGR